MNAAAVHDRIPVDLTPPAADDLVQTAVKIVPLDVIDVPEDSVGDELFPTR